MKIILGADRAAATGHSPAVDKLKRLRFAGATVTVVNVVPPPIYTGWEYDPGIAPAVLADAIKADCDSARALMSQVAEELGASLSPTVRVLTGNPTECLMNEADQIQADLIAVNGTSAGPLVAFLTGSVARGLVIGAHQSVLVARQRHSFQEGEIRPLRAVLATDHSPYAERCLEKLMVFWPQGIQHITVLTSYPEDRIRAMEPLLPELGVGPVEAVRETLEAKNTALIQKLSACSHPMLTTFSSEVSPLPVAEAISQAMEQNGADMLVLGAHGHSFLERLTLGSVSFRQAVFAPYSVLVLRA